MTAEQKKTQRPAVFALLIGIKLLIVCAVVAALISGVNALTDQKYQDNIEAEKAKALSRIFAPDQVEQGQQLRDGVSEVVKDGNVIGYCVEVTNREGFGGDVNMMVGFSTDGTVIGVSIVSHSETPGVGSKVVNNAGYLSENYKGKNGILELGSDVDASAGATVSSSAVLNGVNKATELLNSVVDLGGAA